MRITSNLEPVITPKVENLSIFYIIKNIFRIRNSEKRLIKIKPKGENCALTGPTNIVKW